MDGRSSTESEAEMRSYSASSLQQASGQQSVNVIHNELHAATDDCKSINSDSSSDITSGEAATFSRSRSTDPAKVTVQPHKKKLK